MFVVRGGKPGFKSQRHWRGQIQAEDQCQGKWRFKFMPELETEDCSEVSNSAIFQGKAIQIPNWSLTFVLALTSKLLHSTTRKGSFLIDQNQKPSYQIQSGGTNKCSSWNKRKKNCQVYQTPSSIALVIQFFLKLIKKLITKLWISSRGSNFEDKFTKRLSRTPKSKNQIILRKFHQQY